MLTPDFRESKEMSSPGRRMRESRSALSDRKLEMLERKYRDLEEKLLLRDTMIEEVNGKIDAVATKTLKSQTNQTNLPFEETLTNLNRMLENTERLTTRYQDSSVERASEGKVVKRYPNKRGGFKKTNFSPE